jgi:hypothetical protein
MNSIIDIENNRKQTSKNTMDREANLSSKAPLKKSKYKIAGTKKPIR